MPSKNRTEYLGLNQWEGNEYPKRSDFVEDNAKIDQALKGVNQKIMSHQAESTKKHITESGSNSNGEYIRFDDGTQICWNTLSLGYESNEYLDSTWNFPASFIAIGNVFFLLSSNSADVNITPSRDMIGLSGCSYKSTGVAQFSMRRINGMTDFQDGDSISNCNVFAIGRWK
ncbi:MAG: hypothetical protein N4A64_07025 [Marinisporobacter sp.]|jgi:hypothetical protein|nr:hypothetical protein [Marinisporobacter sp.]